MKKHPHRRFHILVALIVTAIAAYTGFWFFALDQAKKSFAAMVEAERARGNTLTFASAEWGGFPIRLGVDLTEFRYAAGDVAFRSDTARVEVLPWNVTKALARAEGHVVLDYRDSVSSERAELKPGLVFVSLGMTWEGLVQNVDIGLHETPVQGAWQSGQAFDFNAGYLQFDARYTGATEAQAGSSVATTTLTDSYQIAFSADQVHLGQGFDGLLGPKISQIRMAAWLKTLPPFSKGYRPLNWDSLVTMLAEIGTTAEIARADLDWGGIAVRSTGLLKLDEAHRPAGTLDVKVTGLARMVDILLKAGVLQGRLEAAAAIPDGTPVSLLLDKGRVSFGPFQVGEVRPLD